MYRQDPSAAVSEILGRARGFGRARGGVGGRVCGQRMNVKPSPGQSHYHYLNPRPTCTRQASPWPVALSLPPTCCLLLAVLVNHGA